jgi:hypothetical protein
MIFAATNGYLDPIPVSAFANTRRLYRFLETRQSGSSRRWPREDPRRRPQEEPGGVLEEFGKQFSAKTAAA